MNKKFIRISLLIIAFLLTLSNVSFANDIDINIHYFGVDSCISCVKSVSLMEEVIGRVENENVRVNLIKHDTIKKEEEELLIKYNNHFDIEKDKYKLIPAVFIGEFSMIDYEDVRDNFEDYLHYYIDNLSLYKDIIVEDSDSEIKDIKITKLAIFTAGLIDGINPCSIAMMLFFISFIFMTNSNRMQILLIGIFFSLGTFTSYLGIGVGLFRFLYRFKHIILVMRFIYILIAIMCLYLFILNVGDYINIKKGKMENIKNQLSKGMKKTIHNTIKKLNTNERLIYFTAFMTAFIISFLEFFCTGQIYLPIITYLIKTNDLISSHLFLLILYNIAFITPLLLITMFLFLGKEVIDVSTVLVNKLHLIKLMGAIFFMLAFIYTISQVILM